MLVGIVILGWPFLVFSYFPGAWWGLKVLAFGLSYLLFSSFTKSTVEGDVGKTFEYPWYAPLALLFYPVGVLNYLRPNGSVAFQILAFVAGIFFMYRHYSSMGF